jgi:hypothetical protein
MKVELVIGGRMWVIYAHIYAVYMWYAGKNFYHSLSH